MADPKAMRQRAARFHVIADTLLKDDASSSLHEVAAILEQRADLDEARRTKSSAASDLQTAGVTK